MSDGNIEVELNYPDVVSQGNDFVLTTTVKAKSDNISNITITVSSPEIEIMQNDFHVLSLAKDSTLGNNFELKIKQEVPNGNLLINLAVEYFIKGFFDEKPVKNTLTKAIAFNVQSKPILILDAVAPDSVFAGEPFSIRGTIKNHGDDAKNIQIIVESKQVVLEGKKIFSLTSLDTGKTENFEFVVQTPKILSVPTHVIVNIDTSYADESGKTYNQEDSINVFARLRGMLEIGDAGGVWIGDFFIAPVVGVGTIVSSVIGFLIFLWHMKNKKKKRAKR
ncbi:MAG: hypothetical protein HY295_00690 [Thaumarchaeota archaeon]|nr:hypothetical protein [Nitrososphaerota archaeon]